MIALRQAAAEAKRHAGNGIAPAAIGTAPEGRMARPGVNPARPIRTGVGRFLESIEDDAMRVDCLALIGMMREASGCDPVMWGADLVGFGACRSAHESGREGDAPGIGFSPRKGNIAIYLRGGLDAFTEELARLGRHAAGTGCLYLWSLAGVDTKVLKAILERSYRDGSRKNLPPGI
jgi:hypothetical protein